MAEKFLMKYFPIVKIKKIRIDIFSYTLIESNTIYDSWKG